MLERVPASEQHRGSTRVSLAAWLLLSSLPKAVQNELLAAIELGLDCLEARAQPLGIDLGAEELREALYRLQPKVLPSYNAAAHLSAWPWALPQTAEVVVPSRGPRSTLAAIGAWQERAAVDGSRARATRFAAWSLAHGLIVSTGSAAGMDRLRAELGGAIATVSSPPALLVDLRVQRLDNGLVPWERVLELKRRATSLSARVEWAKLSARFPLETQLLEGFRTELPEAPALPWLALGEGELFIAPKLGALARPAELWGVVERAARRAGVTVAAVAGG